MAPIGLGRYWDSNDNKVVVHINQNSMVLTLKSVFQFGVAFSNRLDVRRFVLEMRLSEHKILVSIIGRSISTARSGWLRHWIHFKGRRAAWLYCHGTGTYMPFIRM